MNVAQRTTTRSGLALLASLSLVLIGVGPVFAAEEEEGSKNLSTPVILVDDDAFAASFNPVTVPDLPTGNADYTKDAQDYYTGVGSDTYTSTIDPEFDADQWGADWVAELVSPVVADAKWGDNLLSHVFPGNRRMPIRVEVNLFADAATAAVYGPMLGYSTVSLEGEREGELFGTLGVAEELTPMVYTPDATLTILQYDADTDWYSDVVLAESAMTAEVNGSGKVIYGFNWGKPSGLAQPGPGNYRLIFKVGDDSLLTLGEALGSEESSESGAVHTAYIFGDRITYLDIAVGTIPLVPPLPFEKPVVKNDFNGDGNPDVIARSGNGELWLYPGNGSGGWLQPIKVGVGWNPISTIVAPGDFDGDTNVDLLAVLNNRLLLYRGDGAAGWLGKVSYGTGWDAMTALVGPGDFNGDGSMDLLARDTTGRLYLYPGDGSGGWLPRVAYGTGWNAMDALVGPGDFNGDGSMDLLARDTTGRMYLYPGDGLGGWLPRSQVGSGWSGMTALAGPGDFSGDRSVDVMARNSLGQLLLYRGDGSGGWLLPPWLIGVGWNGMTAIVA